MEGAYGFFNFLNLPDVDIAERNTLIHGNAGIFEALTKNASAIQLRFVYGLNTG